MASRIADLELKVKEKTRIATAVKEEDAKKAAANTMAKATLTKLMGERDYLSGEHGKATADFK